MSSSLVANRWILTCNENSINIITCCHCKNCFNDILISGEFSIGISVGDNSKDSSDTFQISSCWWLKKYLKCIGGTRLDDINMTYIEDRLSMFHCLGHISSSSMEFCIFHIVNFLHNFFSGEGFKSNNIMNVLHKLENGHSSRVVRVRDTKLFIEGVDGRSCKFLFEVKYNYYKKCSRTQNFTWWLSCDH